MALGVKSCYSGLLEPADLTFCRCSSPSSRLNSVLFCSLAMIAWIFVLKLQTGWIYGRGLSLALRVLKVGCDVSPCVHLFVQFGVLLTW